MEIKIVLTVDVEKLTPIVKDQAVDFVRAIHEAAYGYTLHQHIAKLVAPPGDEKP